MRLNLGAPFVKAGARRLSPTLYQRFRRVLFLWLIYHNPALERATLQSGVD